ncbi:MAG: PAS domain S-box protein, partial [Gemmataceae bacterium]|nr:PAS domain S-box protein [Gemmataceae bacterium]
MTDGIELLPTAPGPAPVVGANGGTSVPWAGALTAAGALLALAVGVAFALRRRRKRARPPAPNPFRADPPPEPTDFFRLLFDQHPTPAWAFEEDSLRFVAVNDAVLRRYGYARERLLALTLRDVCPDADADRLAGEPVGPLLWRHRSASGALVPVEVTSRRVLSGGLALRLVVATDLTDRRRAEGELRERDELFRDVLTNVPCAVYWKDRASIYLGCNDQAARDHGFTVPGELIGLTDYDLLQAPDEAEVVRAGDKQVMDAGTPLLDVEETRTLGDGTRATFLTNRVPLRDPAGHVVGVVGVSQNVTERKRLEDQLRHAQKMEAVGRLAGGVAHDFNNLLTVATGSIHLIRGLPPGDPGVLTHVEDIQGAIDRAAALTRQLLTFSRKQP